MNIVSCLDDSNLLGASIKDPASFAPWKALLASAFGLPMDDSALELYRACTGRRNQPSAPCSYLWLVIGRRGGKSFAMALISIFLAVFKDWRKYLSPGERAIVLLVAADREQAKILHRYCQGILSPPILQTLVLNVTASESPSPLKCKLQFYWPLHAHGGAPLGCRGTLHLNRHPPDDSLGEGEVAAL